MVESAEIKFSDCCKENSSDVSEAYLSEKKGKSEESDTNNSSKCTIPHERKASRIEFILAMAMLFFNVPLIYMRVYKV